MRQMQSVENPDKSDPGNRPGSGRGNNHDPRPAWGQCPEEATLNKPNTGCATAWAETAQIQGRKWRKTLLNTKTLKLLAADSAKPEEGTMNTSQKKSTPSTQQERRNVFSQSGEVSDGRTDGSISANEGCTQRRRSSEERRKSKGTSRITKDDRDTVDV